MPEYIERKEAIEFVRNNTPHFDGETTMQCVERSLANVPAADVVSSAVLEQVMWERDMALETLKEHGIGFCEKSDMVEVRHGEWLLKSRIYKMPDDFDEEFYVECPFCQRTFYVPFEFEKEKMLAYAKENYPYCNCGAKMDGKEVANSG